MEFPRPDLWLRRYAAGILYALLEAPTALLDALADIYEAIWRPLVDALDTSAYLGDEDEEEEE